MEVQFVFSYNVLCLAPTVHMLFLHTRSSSMETSPFHAEKRFVCDTSIANILQIILFCNRFKHTNFQEACSFTLYHFIHLVLIIGDFTILTSLIIIFCSNERLQTLIQITYDIITTLIICQQYQVGIFSFSIFLCLLHNQSKYPKVQKSPADFSVHRGVSFQYSYKLISTSLATAMSSSS